MGSPVAYQYLVLRCMPRVDRGEFVNIGVVLYCQRPAYLGCLSHLDADRLRSLDRQVDLQTVAEALASVAAVCAGDESAGSAARLDPGTRFGHLAAPRSTVVQPGPVHGGVTAGDPPDF